MGFEFDGAAYEKASSHQKEWGGALMLDFDCAGDEAILDLGCGDGVLTERLADAVPRGSVLGIDASQGMIDVAMRRRRDNLAFVRMDIGDIDFADRFDVIYSNAALHWVLDHRAVLAHSYRALRDGGRIAWSFGGRGNCENLNESLRDVMRRDAFAPLFTDFAWPWYMPGVDEYRALVDGIGFADVRIEMVDADRFFADADAMIAWIDQPCIVPFLAAIGDAGERHRFRDAVIEDMMIRCRQQDGRCFETFRRLKIVARKPVCVAICSE